MSACTAVTIEPGARRADWKASLISPRSRSASHASRSGTVWMALAGLSGNEVSAPAICAWARKTAKIGSPSNWAVSRQVNTSATAPSINGDAFLAVAVPSREKAGCSRARGSREVSGCRLPVSHGIVRECVRQSFVCRGVRNVQPTTWIPARVGAGGEELGSLTSVPGDDDCRVTYAEHPRGLDNRGHPGEADLVYSDRWSRQRHSCSDCALTGRVLTRA